jgi:ADP-ribosylglycohydrolase
MINKIKGLIYGLAIGDAMGKPTEFITLEKIKSIYGREGIQDLEGEALYTDDTQMTLAIVRALIKSGENDTEIIMQSVKDEFNKWVYSDEWFKGGAGRTCTQGVLNMRKGIHWSKSGIKDSKGCGTAMRVLPVGLFYQNNLDKLKEIAYSTGICTHNHPTADAACIGAAFAVKYILDENPIILLPKYIAEFTEGISEEWDAALTKLHKVLTDRSFWGAENEEKALKYLGEGWVAEEAVTLALYCFLTHHKDYKKVVIRAANTNGDSDSIGCIAGGFAGAYLGIEGIPKDWIQRIDNSAYLNEISEDIFNKLEEL